VTVFDDLSRPGAQRNASWLRSRHPRRVKLVVADVRTAVFEPLLRDVDTVYHLAAQVAVTTSLLDPPLDFEVNALGTLRLLEAMRRVPEPPALVYTSTNKVYGALDDLRLELTSAGWRPGDAAALSGVDESRPLDLHSPYGCSKGAAEQYVRDYARSFGLHTAALRMSCIYGPHQNGTEDQGWVAHFARCALAGRPVTIYGDGHQVRDILHVDDLCRALAAVAKSPAGRIYNLGGGPENAVSLLQVLRELEAITGGDVGTAHDAWRVGDQRWYVSDCGAAERDLGWRPRIGWREGLENLVQWLRSESQAAVKDGTQVA
jgi:CDP-paratose 2-epimerase